MKIAFAKISAAPVPFEILRDGLKLSGNLKRKDSKFIECKGEIKGKIPYICDRCGKEFDLDVNESVNLLLSEGVFNDERHESLDVMEFFGAEVDVDEILRSEMEAFKSDYFYCEECKN
ncbi:hypothetical protein [uncultured Campylobacter sp.]|uniref:hypothetical protein n=1 Tax=uncultured Campylobacter sp. TaxID=218934 RepID=UPI002604EDEA|nr:hypothetical protein [uncultured Campylobacter sp.]